MTRKLLVLTVLLLLMTITLSPVQANEPWQAGVARVVITPDEFMWMSGYGGRDHAAEGQIHDLYARAAALQGPDGTRTVFIALDLIGVPVKMAQVVAAEIEKQHKLPRRHLMFASSHTHCGPALDDKLSHMLAMKDNDWTQVRKYQAVLNRKVIQVINVALADIKPARLSFGNGKCGFASNRRAPIGTGPYDHQVPVLRIDSPSGQLRGVVFGYACHNTVMGFYQWSGDYAGFAQLDLEGRHAGAVAMFFTGCGADQNPLPRRKLELAEKYGRMLAVSVDEVLTSGSMQPLTGTITPHFEEIPLELASLPTKEKLTAEAAGTDRFLRARAKLLLEQLSVEGAVRQTYPYPVQVWKLGNEITWVALGGEVVIDYQLRLKRELGEHSTWVAGYANDVMAYIPSERVLAEGGYEGESSMVYYQLPSKWKSGLEDQIVGTVHKLAGK